MHRYSTGSRNACSRGRWRMVSWPWASTNRGLWMSLAWSKRSQGSASIEGVSEAKNSSCRMADGDEIERLMCSGQSQHPFHFAILECAYWNRSQIHCDGLQK